VYEKQRRFSSIPRMTGEVTAAPLAGEAAAAALAQQLPRHRHGLSRDAVRASQSARILIATAEVVAQNGYAATSVAAIVARAGVSRKTFYELYADKEEAFLDAYRAVDVVIARMTAAAAAEREPRAMLRAGVRAFLETLAAAPAFTRMLVIEAVGAGPRVLQRRAAAFDDFVRVLAAPLAAAHAADPSVPAPDEAILLALLGGINELALQHLVAQEAETLPDLAPTIDVLIERVCFPG
jgi:AcrR family transcriptional regulator